MSKVITQQQSLIPSLLGQYTQAGTQQRVAFSALAVVLGVTLMAALAHVRIALPFTPVPITGQTFGVTLIAFTLGSRLSSLTLLAYLLVGALGAPVFANAPGAHTAGYLIGMLVAAALVGRLSDLGWAKSFTKAFVASTLGTAVIFAFGLTVLANFVGSERVLVLGLYPFLPGALIKITLAAAVATGLHRKS